MNILALTDNVRLIGNLIHSTFWQHFVSKAFFCDWRCDKKWRSTPKPNFIWRAPWVYDVHIISDIWFRILCSPLLKCKGFKNEFIKHFSWGSNRFTISKWSTWIGNYNILYSYIFNWFKLYLERKWILCFIIKWILRVLPFWLHWWEYYSTFVCLMSFWLVGWGLSSDIILDSLDNCPKAISLFMSNNKLSFILVIKFKGEDKNEFYSLKKLLIPWM